MHPPRLDVELGMRCYVSKTPPVNCKLRVFNEDFKVMEVSEEGIIVKEPKSLELTLVNKHGLFSLFLLRKVGVSHLEAMQWVTHKIGVSMNKLSFAGIKDSRAHTCQLLTVPRTLQGTKITCIGKIFHDGKELHLSLLGYCPRGLYPGANRGNFFEVVIRNIPKHVDIFQHVEKTLEEALSNGGIPNYFGYQRFGIIRPNTHMIGRYIITQNYEMALLELLTTPYPLESTRILEARKYLQETFDFSGALRLFPKHFTIERRILRYLSKHPKDYSNAFKVLPRWLRGLFIQAYQSYLYNVMLSKRLKLGITFHEVMSGEAVIHAHRREIMIVTSSNKRYAQRLLDNARAYLCIRLPGYEPPPPSTFAYELMKEVLEEEGMNYNMFKINNRLFPSFKGGWRLASLRFSGISISGISEDESFPGSLKVKISTFLEKGCYMTVLLREIFKPRDPASQGF